MNTEARSSDIIFAAIIYLAILLSSGWICAGSYGRGMEPSHREVRHVSLLETR
jgi:hypothetical protein